MKIDEKTYQFTWDKNADHNFDNDTSFNMSLGTPRKILFEFFTPEHDTLLLPVLVDIIYRNGNVWVTTKSLFCYEIQEPFRAQIYPHKFMNGILVDSMIEKFKQKKLFGEGYYVDEPFLKDNQWYALRNFDFVKLTATLDSYPPDFKPFGRKVGYYVDVERLKKITLPETETLAKWVRSETPKVTLLHFWGPWCVPCLKELDKAKKLETQILPEMDYISYSFSFSEEDSIKTLALAAKGEAPATQSVVRSRKKPLPPSEKYEGKNHYKDATDPFILLDVQIFPSYMLLDRDGKILFRGKYDDLMSELKTRKLLLTQ